MLRTCFVAAALVLAVLVGGCKNALSPQTPPPPPPASPARTSEVTDPVCRQAIDRADWLITDYDGKTYAFCSEECFEQFRSDPRRYVTPPTIEPRWRRRGVGRMGIERDYEFDPTRRQR
ncbi:MAG: YHS domain-containing protein [Planctomycetes bacterium]|nr:YHS domain-containing protein [Planctomycetota bacterium]